MKTINFATALFNLKGETLKNDDKTEIILSEVLANSLMQAKAKNPLRQIDVARKIYESKGPIQLEDADFNMVKEVVKGLDFTCLVAGAIEQCFKLAVEEPKV